MPKKIGIIALIIIALVVILGPVRKNVINFINKSNKATSEIQIIGSISGFSPRVKQVQKILEDLGFDAGSVDGRMGTQTRKAIAEFQKSKKLATTGKIDANTWEELNKEKEKLIENILSSKGDYEPMLEAQDFVAIEDKGDKPSPEKMIQKFQIQDEVMGYRLKSKNRAKEIQIALKKAGFYRGDIDGRLGPQTKIAIKAFQKSKGLYPDGAVGVKTWKELAKILKN